MRCRRALLTALLCMPFIAVAASFDCAKASTRVEQMICSDAELSTLDDELAAAYATTYSASTRLDELVEVQQRRWLVRRNACRDRGCIINAYYTRVKELGGKPEIDPLDDQQLTCEEMRRHPDRIFGQAIDLGSGTGSPIKVDYACKESLASLPFMRRLHALTEEVRSDGALSCTGDLMAALWRYYHFELLWAGFAPHLLSVGSGGGETALLRYFERWSYEGIYNHELHRVYLEELQAATEQLARHYEATFRYPAPRARQLARTATGFFLGRAAGSFPEKSAAGTKRMLQTARMVEASLETLKARLPGMSAGEVQTALNIALLKQRPAAHISLLVERAGQLNRGDEPPLFFALRNASNVRFLLDRGADVNYPNRFGKTALYYAIGFNDRRMVELLLDRGAAVNHKYANPEKDDGMCIHRVTSGRTPLMHAAQHADVAMLGLLLERGASLKELDEAGDNATAYALQHKRGENAAYLESIGLRVPTQEEKTKRFYDCTDAVARQRLEGKAEEDFLASCLRG
jgi:uncharacterized protein